MKTELLRMRSVEEADDTVFERSFEALKRNRRKDAAQIGCQAASKEMINVNNITPGHSDIVWRKETPPSWSGK